MLILLLALLLAALERLGVVRRKTALSLLKTVLICVGFALAYDGAARILYALIYNAEGAPGLRELYGIGRLEPFLSGVETGSGLINLPGHALGKLFFGEYLMGGAVFSTLLTVTALHLVYLRLRNCYDERTARTAQALTLAFPCSFFCFLPGWTAWALLGAALAFCFAGKHWMRATPAEYPWPAGTVEAAFACLALLNAMLLLLTVMKK